jgi:hypothetical protein
MDAEFSYGPETFPFHPDCYTWPQVAVVTEEMESVILSIHCLHNVECQQFSLIGFIGTDREDQISQTIFLAQQASAEVIVIKGVGFNDEIISTLMATMKEPLPEECPGEKLAMLITDWPTRFQRHVLREAVDMSRHGDFHEESLAYRMKAPVEEIRQHLELLADLGLMEAK